MKPDFIHTLPKVELHCHLDGSLPMGIIRELLGRDVKKEELQVRDDCRNLAEYLEKFDLPLSCMQTETGLKRTSKAFLESLKQDNIQYVEVRFAPLLSVNESLDCTRVIQSVLEGLEEAKKECGIYYNVIACAMRHHTEEDNLQMMKAARSFFRGKEFVLWIWQEMKLHSLWKISQNYFRKQKTGAAFYHSCRRMWKSRKCHRGS